MLLRDLNEYRNAGYRKRQSTKMRRLRTEIDTILLRIRADDKPPEWEELITRRYIRSQSIGYVCEEMHISEATYFRTLRKIKAYITR